MLAKLKTRKRLRVHGFLNRNSAVLKSRRAKGRKRLTVSIPTKK